MFPTTPVKSLPSLGSPGTVNQQSIKEQFIQCQTQAENQTQQLLDFVRTEYTSVLDASEQVPNLITKSQKILHKIEGIKLHSRQINTQITIPALLSTSNSKIEISTAHQFINKVPIILPISLGSSHYYKAVAIFNNAIFYSTKCSQSDSQTSISTIINQLKPNSLYFNLLKSSLSTFNQLCLNVEMFSKDQWTVLQTQQNFGSWSQLLFSYHLFHHKDMISVLNKIVSTELNWIENQLLFLETSGKRPHSWFFQKSLVQPFDITIGLVRILFLRINHLYSLNYSQSDSSEFLQYQNFELGHQLMDLDSVVQFPLRCTLDQLSQISKEYYIRIGTLIRQYTTISLQDLNLGSTLKTIENLFSYFDFSFQHSQKESMMNDSFVLSQKCINYQIWKSEMISHCFSNDPKYSFEPFIDFCVPCIEKKIVSLVKDTPWVLFQEPSLSHISEFRLYLQSVVVQIQQLSMFQDVLDPLLVQTLKLFQPYFTPVDGNNTSLLGPTHTSQTLWDKTIEYCCFTGQSPVHFYYLESIRKTLIKALSKSLETGTLLEIDSILNQPRIETIFQHLSYSTPTEPMTNNNIRDGYSFEKRLSNLFFSKFSETLDQLDQTQKMNKYFSQLSVSLTEFTVVPPKFHETGFIKYCPGVWVPFRISPFIREVFLIPMRNQVLSLMKQYTFISKNKQLALRVIKCFQSHFLKQFDSIFCDLKIDQKIPESILLQLLFDYGVVIQLYGSKFKGSFWSKASQHFDPIDWNLYQRGLLHYISLFLTSNSVFFQSSMFPSSSRASSSESLQKACGDKLVNPGPRLTLLS